MVGEIHAPLTDTKHQVREDYEALFPFLSTLHRHESTAVRLRGRRQATTLHEAGQLPQEFSHEVVQKENQVKRTFVYSDEEKAGTNV